MTGVSRKKNEFLKGPLLKIERARQHMQELDRHLAAFLALAPYRLRLRQTSLPRQRWVLTDTLFPVPDQIAPIIGDAVHNLRVALEHTAYAILCDNAPNRKSIGFPFSEEKEGFPKAMSKTQMDLARSAVADEVRALQPYRDGTRHLWAVHALDMQDKHRAILLVGQHAAFNREQLAALLNPVPLPDSLPVGAMIGVAGDFVVQLGGTHPISEFDREAEFQPAYTLAFGPDEPLAGEVITTALGEMATSTEAAVRRIAAAFFR